MAGKKDGVGICVFGKGKDERNPNPFPDPGVGEDHLGQDVLLQWESGSSVVLEQREAWILTVGSHGRPCHESKK